MPFRLVWSSSAQCGDARGFLAELQGRTKLLRQAQGTEHALVLIVETFNKGAGVRGQLTVRRVDGELTVREVPGQNCGEVESAMALIAALMVDPLAGSAERTPVERPVRQEPRKNVLSGAAPERRWSLRVEQRLTVRSAVAPGLAWGQALGAMITSEKSRLFPSLGLSVQAAGATTSAARGSAAFDWATGQVTLCPLALRPNERSELRACGALQLGRLLGQGFNTVDPGTKRLFWSAAVAELEGRYRLLGPLWLGLEGSFFVPFSHARFYLEPAATLHRIPAWGVGFGAGLGLSFF